MPLPFNQYSGSDDQRVRVIRRSISGGINNRQEGNVLKENQVTSLVNVEIDVDGSAKKRKGTALVEDLGNDAGLGAYGFHPDGSANTLFVTHGQKIEDLAVPLSGTFTENKADYTTDLQGGFAKLYKSGTGDVLMHGNGTDNCFEYDPADYTSPTDLGDTNTSPPVTNVMAEFRNRWWMLKSNLLYYSDAAASDYSAAFNRSTNSFRIPVGTERAIVALRDTGLAILGQEAIWGLAPSATPAATDLPQKLLDIGCSAGKTAKLVGDDVLFLAPDGVRGIFRTQQDKLQMGQSVPLSYAIKEEFESINWSAANKATAIWFNNKYYLAVPVDSSTYNNEVWVYYPSFQSWSVITGWNVADWAKLDSNGEDTLCYIDSNDGSVYKLSDAVDQDAGSDFAFSIEGRKEDLGDILKKKNGGEVYVKAKATGASSLTVDFSIDESEYGNLGTMSLAGNLISFPVTFPVSFSDPNIAKEKFHIDSYGGWYTGRIRLTNTSSDDIDVLETSIITYADEYADEE